VQDRMWLLSSYATSQQGVDLLKGQKYILILCFTRMRLYRRPCCLMPLKTLVKVSTVTCLRDARYCAGMGVDLLGLPLDPNHRHYLDPTQFQAFAQWLEGIALVGELSTTHPSLIRRTAEQYVLDYLQLTPAVDVQCMASLALPVVLQLSLTGNETFTALQALMQRYAPYVRYFLLEATCTPETDFAHLQPTIDALALDFPILQGSHVSEATLPHLLNTGLQGIALQRGAATTPDHKSFDALVEMLAFLAVE